MTGYAAGTEYLKNKADIKFQQNQERGQGKKVYTYEELEEAIEVDKKLKSFGIDKPKFDDVPIIDQLEAEIVDVNDIPDGLKEIVEQHQHIILQSKVYENILGI